MNSIWQTDDEDEDADDVTVSEKSISVTGKREISHRTDRSSVLPSKSSDRRPPIFEQKVEQMYKDEESSSDEGRNNIILFLSSVLRLRSLRSLIRSVL